MQRYEKMVKKWSKWNITNKKTINNGTLNKIVLLWNIKHDLGFGNKYRGF